MKATDILRNEHEVILDVLAALESISQQALAGQRLDVGSARDVLEFLRGFCDRCHHGKEEQLFFPALTAAGLPRGAGPVAVMMAEHEEGRAYIACMVEALADVAHRNPGSESRFAAAAMKYVELMRGHIDKENGVLFPMGDVMLPEARQAELLRAMETFEHADMGEGAHARFLDIASGLGQRLGLERTSRAAASTPACCGHGTRCA